MWVIFKANIVLFLLIYLKTCKIKATHELNYMLTKEFYLIFKKYDQKSQKTTFLDQWV